jgi:hypothetical protein
VQQQAPQPISQPPLPIASPNYHVQDNPTAAINNNVLSDANPPVEQPDIDTTNVAPGTLRDDPISIQNNLNPTKSHMPSLAQDPHLLSANTPTMPYETAIATLAPLSSPTAPSPAPPSRIKLRATDETSVQIFDAFGKMIAERVINRGEAFYVPDKAGYTFATSNAGALRLQIDGREMQPIGDSDEPMHNIPLQAESLKKILQ